MGSAVTYVIELLVGGACLALAAAMLRARRLLPVAAVLALAGLAAAGHAVIRLAQ